MVHKSESNKTKCPLLWISDNLKRKEIWNHREIDVNVHMSPWILFPILIMLSQLTFKTCYYWNTKLIFTRKNCYKKLYCIFSINLQEIYCHKFCIVNLVNIFAYVKFHVLFPYSQIFDMAMKSMNIKVYFNSFNSSRFCFLLHLKLFMYHL